MSLAKPFYQLRRTQAFEDHVFGARLPHLPDFLSDTATVGASEAERIAAVLERWTELIANLWKWHRCAFSLRLRTRPERGAIDIAILIRATAPSEQAPMMAQALVDEVGHLLARLHIPYQPIVVAAELQDFLVPFDRPTLFELRQAEEVIPLQIGGEAYIVYPFWNAVGDGLGLFETLVLQRQPALVNIHLEPTVLHTNERDMLAMAASLGHEMADFQYNGHFWQNLRIRDPQAELIGRIYAANVRRLGEPFMLTTQVASPDPLTAGIIARALSASFSAGQTKQPNQQDQQLPTRIDMLAPAQADEYNAALRTLMMLWLTDWGANASGAHQQRLRYLSDARGAATAFRLPIALRSGVPGIVTRQVAPAYSLGPRKIARALDEIELGTLDNGGVVTIHKNELVRHTLIAGFTRSGKTNSCLNLLDQLWRDHHIPFLAIEPVKTEYRGLLRQVGFETLLVFTLGDETIAPFRLNPFELLPGIRLEAHIGSLRTCFDAALPQFGVLPMLLEESIHKIYADLGWQLTDKGSDAPAHPFPTLTDLHKALDQAVATYAGELKQNLQAALSKRVGSLLKGSKGRMFNTQRSIPMDILLERPVIIEMDRLSQDEQPLAMMFMLMFVREYCRLHRSRQIRHVTLIEEAHLIMADAKPVSNPENAANTQAEGSQAFERMLAEIGGLGEGIVVAEQSPSKLVLGAINNTNLKISHQLIGPREVETVGGAMIMDEQQKMQVQRLRVGHAAVFMSGYEKATFMVAPAYKHEHQFDDQLSDDDVAEHMRSFYASQPQSTTATSLDTALPFGGCQFCASACKYRAVIEPVTHDVELHRQFYNVWIAYSSAQQNLVQQRRAWQHFVAVTISAGAQAGAPGAIDAAWCYWVQQAGSNFVFTAEQRATFETMYRSIIDDSTS